MTIDYVPKPFARYVSVYPMARPAELAQKFKITIATARWYRAALVTQGRALPLVPRIKEIIYRGTAYESWDALSKALAIPVYRLKKGTVTYHEGQFILTNVPESRRIKEIVTDTGKLSPMEFAEQRGIPRTELYRHSYVDDQGQRRARPSQGIQGVREWVGTLTHPSLYQRLAHIMRDWLPLDWSYLTTKRYVMLREYLLTQTPDVGLVDRILLDVSIHLGKSYQ